MKKKLLFLLPILCLTSCGKTPTSESSSTPVSEESAPISEESVPVEESSEESFIHSEEESIEPSEEESVPVSEEESLAPSEEESLAPSGEESVPAASEEESIVESEEKSEPIEESETIPSVLYYVVGSFNDWVTQDSNYVMTPDKSDANHFTFAHFEMNAGTELKCVSSKGTWYPDGMGNNIKVPEDGVYTVHLRTNASKDKMTTLEKEAEEESTTVSESEDEGELPLPKDASTGYTFENVSNADGSMSYEIFVRSFYDSDGNGIGDLRGVDSKIPYLADLGIKTIWLMPIHPSPSYHGYDVTDYYAINPDYGTLNDFDSLVATASTYNIDIMIDMVINHSAKNCQYFLDSYSDYISGNTDADSRADWYSWSDTAKAGYSQYGNVYIESNFDQSMPEFNYDSEGFRNELDNIFKFWVQDHGVKGFRLDAVLYYYYNNHAKNAEVLTFLEQLGKKYNPDFHMVGECWQTFSIMQRYMTSEIDSLFSFQSALSAGGTGVQINTMAKGSGSASTFLTKMTNNENKVHTNNPNGYSSYFISNHDMDRASSALKGVNSKVAASILGLLPGTPYMYYGEEIELLGSRGSEPTDVMRRLPMIWSKNNKTGECGFPERNYSYLSYDQVEDGVEDQLQDGFSLLNHYKKVINIRNKYPFMKHGILTSMMDELEIENKKVLAYKIALDDDYVVIITNINDTNFEVNVGDLKIKDSINTMHLIPQINNGVLRIGAKSTVVLQ